MVRRNRAGSRRVQPSCAGRLGGPGGRRHRTGRGHRRGAGRRGRSGVQRRHRCRAHEPRHLGARRLRHGRRLAVVRCRRGAAAVSPSDRRRPRRARGRSLSPARRRRSGGVRPCAGLHAMRSGAHDHRRPARRVRGPRELRPRQHGRRGGERRQRPPRGGDEHRRDDRDHPGARRRRAARRRRDVRRRARCLLVHRRWRGVRAGVRGVLDGRECRRRRADGGRAFRGTRAEALRRLRRPHPARQEPATSASRGRRRRCRMRSLGRTGP